MLAQCTRRYLESTMLERPLLPLRGRAWVTESRWLWVTINGENIKLLETFNLWNSKALIILYIWRGHPILIFEHSLCNFLLFWRIVKRQCFEILNLSSYFCRYISALFCCCYISNCEDLFSNKPDMSKSD